MGDSKITKTSVEEHQSFVEQTPVPVLLVAHAPPDATTVDRCRLGANFLVGRGGDNHLSVRDHKISGRHFRIFSDGSGFCIEDAGSTNGTHVDGERLTGTRVLQNSAVIRAGHTVFVFHRAGEACLAPPPLHRYGMAGQFHVGPILKQIVEAALSKEHLLIQGPSGTGKELAAMAIAEIMGDGNGPVPFIAHNAAGFASETDAASTLFGVGKRSFTSVDSTPGLIEQAEGGGLFLDEIHNYTTRVQRSLLRVIEDRNYMRIGETIARTANVRFVMASNERDLSHAIAPDLLGRVRRSIEIPPLSERRADIPSIFDHVLKKKLEQYDISAQSVMPHLHGEHYALMCQHGFQTYNVRGLRQVADIIATRIFAGTPPDKSINEVFAQQFGKFVSSRKVLPNTTSPPRAPTALSDDLPQVEGNSWYEQNKELIIATYLDRDGNCSSTTRALKAQGGACSRKFISIYLKKWGVKKPRNWGTGG